MILQIHFCTFHLKYVVLYSLEVKTMRLADDHLEQW
jgi:hypothetical protein